MSISSVSSPGNTYQQTNQVSPFKQAKQDYAALAQALAAGNISAAQQAFSAFQQDLQSVQQTQGAQQPVQATQSAKGGIQGDLSSLSQALSTGDMSAAQTAFANLQKDAQTATAGRPHHHHHHGEGTQSVAAATTVTGATATSGGGINTTA